MPNTATLVDTGFLVALFAVNDNHHVAAKAFLQANPQLELHSVWPVVTETCFFLDVPGKQALLQWLEYGAVTMYDIRTNDFPTVRGILQKYSNLSPDFTDAVLLSVAESTRIRRILTVDIRDFSVYRFEDGSAFERLWI